MIYWQAELGRKRWWKRCNVIVGTNHTFARISDNALCFSDKTKAASVYSAGGSGERKHAHTKTLAALLFSLSTTAKEFDIEQSIECLKMITQIKRMTTEMLKMISS